METNSFAVRLKKIRKESNIRQQDLAKSLNLAQTTIANYEQGTRFPDEGLLIKIADFFDVSLDYLFARTNIRNANEGISLRNSTLLSSSLVDPAFISLKSDYLEALLSGKEYLASKLILKAVENNQDIKKIYIDIFERSLVEIGQLWEIGVIDIAQEHYFSQCTQLIMSQLYPYILKADKNSYSCISLSVYGEQHIIGIRMVTDFLELDGWNTCFLGSDVPTQSVLKMLDDRKADLIAISATMPSYIDSVFNLTRAIRSSKKHADLKVILGGQAFNLDKQIWKSLLADGISSSASEAVELANRLVKLT